MKGDDAKRFAGEIHKSSQRLLSLINDIIRISELDAISTEEIFETVNLYETARSTVQMLEISAQKHSIIIDVTGSLRSLYITCVIMRYVTIIRVERLRYLCIHDRIMV